MNLTSEVRRLAFRTKYLTMTVLIFFPAFVVAALQLSVFAGNDHFSNFANIYIPVTVVSYAAWIFNLAKHNVQESKSARQATSPPGQ